MSALLNTEHAKGLHGLHPMPSCQECFPDGVSQRMIDIPASPPAPMVPPRPAWQAAPHRFRASSFRREDGERLCECGEIRDALLHVAVESGNLGRSLTKIMGHPTVEVPYGNPYAALESGDGGPKCSVCKGVRRVRRDVPIEHPDFGKALECMSPQCAAFLAQQRLDKLLGELPIHFREWTLEMVAARYPRAVLGARLVQLGRDLLDDPALPWMLLYGKSGRGKTVMAVAILIAAVTIPGRTGVFQEAGQILRLVRSTYRSREAYTTDEHDILSALHSAQLLVVDDLGKENDTDWASELLADVIGGRHANRRQTIITSNYSLEELGDRIGTPTASRIAEMTPERYRLDFSKLVNLRQSVRAVTL